MNGFIALNRLLLAITSVIPAAVFTAALVTFAAYWFFVGRHSKPTEQDAEAMRIMQDIRIGLSLRNRRSDVQTEVTTNEETAN